MDTRSVQIKTQKLNIHEENSLMVLTKNKRDNKNNK